MKRFAGAKRFVFNKALALQNRTTEKRTRTSRLRRSSAVNSLSGDTSPQTHVALRNAPVHPLQQALKDLDKAFVNHKEGRAEEPKFKKRGRTAESFRYPDPQQIKLDQQNNRLKLPKLGWIRYRNSRPMTRQPQTRHRQRVSRQVVRHHPDRTRRGTIYTTHWKAHRHRHGRQAICYRFSATESHITADC